MLVRSLLDAHNFVLQFDFVVDVGQETLGVRESLGLGNQFFPIYISRCIRQLVCEGYSGFKLGG